MQISPTESVVRQRTLGRTNNSNINDRVALALEEFAKAQESGKPISREFLLLKYSDVADELNGCLDSLNFIRQVAPQLGDNTTAAAKSTEAPCHSRAALGDFRIIREIGRGGMGVVYEAEQISLGRTVALKVLPFAAMLDERQLTRFRNEARAAASLHHTNLVPVHSVGCERGVHYYAMSMNTDRPQWSLSSKNLAGSLHWGGSDSMPLGRFETMPDLGLGIQLQSTVPTNTIILKEVIGFLGIAVANKKQRRRIPGVPGKNSAPADRVLWLLDALWDGNRSRMARAVGVSHTVLVKIAAGQQGPGPQLLQAISSHSKVNPVWLLTGSGEPLLATATDSTEGWPVPIAHQLLPGPLEQHRHLLTGRTFPLAGAYYTKSRYWFRVPSTEPLANSRASGLFIGDLLLVETDPIYWQDPFYLDWSFCAVGTRKNELPELALVRWFSGQDDEPPCLEVFRYSQQPGSLTRRKRFIFDVQLDPSGTLSNARVRQIPAEAKPGAPPVVAPQTERIEIRDIVGAGVMLIRGFSMAR